jgi:hypothetical protein
LVPVLKRELRALTASQAQAKRLESDKVELLARVHDLEAQACSDMECTIGQMMSPELAEKHGLDDVGHRRNIQHIFMRCCLAIDELEKENFSLAAQCCHHKDGVYGTAGGTPTCTLEAQAKRMAGALEHSLKLQENYATLLNMYDGGERIIFNSVDEWVDRLKELGEIK